MPAARRGRTYLGLLEGANAVRDLLILDFSRESSKANDFVKHPSKMVCGNAGLRLEYPTAHMSAN